MDSGHGHHDMTHHDHHNMPSPNQNHMTNHTVARSGMMTSGHGDGHAMGGETMNMDMPMNMYFHVGVMETILFKFWKTYSAGAMVGSCIILFVVALLYEGLKVLREELLYKAHLQLQGDPRSLGAQDELDNQGNGAARSDQVILQQGHDIRRKMCNKWHGLQTFLHIFQVTVSYMLMLVFMTYNVWLCLSVVLGAGAGYFLFGWRKQTVLDVNEHCH